MGSKRKKELKRRKLKKRRKFDERKRLQKVDKIKTFGDSALFETAADVDDPTSVDEKVVEMQKILAATKDGVGLAAPQIGWSKRVFVTRYQGESHTFINPVITELSDSTATENERCLSYPGVETPVERSTTITLTWTDSDGENHDKEFHGFLARVIQHEMDHLADPPVCHVGKKWLKAQAAKFHKNSSRPSYNQKTLNMTKA